MSQTAEKKSAGPPLPTGFYRRLINPLVGFLLRSPVGRGMGKAILLLTYTGRKSGKLYSTPVSYTREGDVFSLFTDSAWAFNFIDPAAVTILVAGQVLHGTARTVTDPQHVAQAVIRELQNHGRMAARRHGLRPGEMPGPEEVIAANPDRKLVLINLEPGKRTVR